jgi:hypothetical protein
MLEQLIPPPLVMIDPRSSTPKRTSKRTKQPAAIRINYHSARRSPGPIAVFRSSNPGGETYEAETILEESFHLMEEIAQLNSEVRPLRESLRNLMEDFKDASPKFDGSSGPCILTHELESAREGFDRVCAQEADLLNQFSIDATATLRKTVTEQRQLFDALKLNVESVEQELVEAEAELENRGWKARKQKFENGNRTQHALRSELAKLRERERQIRQRKTQGSALPRESESDAEVEIERLTRELNFLRQYKEQQLKNVRGLRAGKVPEMSGGGTAGFHFYTGESDQSDEEGGSEEDSDAVELSRAEFGGR